MLNSESVSLPKLMLLCGRMYAGKDNIADAIIRTGDETESFRAVKLPFALALKEEVAKKHNVTLEELARRKSEFRNELQSIGNGNREGDEDYWVRRWYRRYTQTTTNHMLSVLNSQQTWTVRHDGNVQVVQPNAPRPLIVLVTDGRYPNEARFVNQLGGLVLMVDTPDDVRIQRGEALLPGYTEQHDKLSQHPSESSVDACARHSHGSISGTLSSDDQIMRTIGAIAKLCRRP